MAEVRDVQSMCKVVLAHAAERGHVLVPGRLSAKPVMLEGDTAVALVHPALSVLGVAAVERLVGRAAAGQLAALLYTLGPLSSDAAAFAGRAAVVVHTVSSDGAIEGGEDPPGEDLTTVEVCPEADPDGFWRSEYGDEWREHVRPSGTIVRCPDTGFAAVVTTVVQPFCECGAEFPYPKSWDVLTDAVLVRVSEEVQRRLADPPRRPKSPTFSHAKADDPWEVHLTKTKRRTLCGQPVAYTVGAVVGCEPCKANRNQLLAPEREWDAAIKQLHDDDGDLSAGVFLPSAGISRDLARRMANVVTEGDHPDDDPDLATLPWELHSLCEVVGRRLWWGDQSERFDL